jgi:hypothetical protein
MPRRIAAKIAKLPELRRRKGPRVEGPRRPCRGSATGVLDAAPAPWRVEETDACFIVRDANGQALAASPKKNTP